MFIRQLNSLSTHIIDHKGPVILAGDFNAWSRPRVNVLKRFARRLKLKEVIFENALALLVSHLIIYFIVDYH